MGNLSMILKFIFKYIIVIAIAQEIDQPARWPKIDQDHEFFATKSVLNAAKGDNYESEFVQFYFKSSENTESQVMSVRKHGIYTSAYWDFTNKKAHFLYDKYSCDTKLLSDFGKGPIYTLDYLNTLSEIKYYFVPIIQILESEDLTTDPKPIRAETNRIRDRLAWQWRARIRADGYSRAADIFYSIETDERKSVPLRIVIYTDEDARDVFLIWEIFKFRLGTPDAEVFEFPELAVCQTSNYPRIPQINSDFHVKMEVRDRIPGVYESPIYDMNLHYEYSLKLSRYTFATNGIDFLVNIFGTTELEIIDDFKSDIGYIIDTQLGNCTAYAMNVNGSDDFPGSDTWIHGGIISMRDPEWFWHIPHPEAYWYKGKSTLRYIDSHSWSMKRPTDPDSPRKNPGYYFEWHFADENWIFYEGERQDEKREQLQPLMLRTRSIVPPEGGRPEDQGHHHTDYTIYYYADGIAANRYDLMDRVSLCYSGERHKFFQFNVTDKDGTGRIISGGTGLNDAFHKLWAAAIADAADIGRLRINRLRIIGLGQQVNLTVQFYMLDRLRIAHDFEHGLDHATDNFVAALNAGKMHIDMSNFIGYDAQYLADPSSMRDEEFIESTVEYKKQTVIDGHSDGAFAGAAIGSIIAGAIVGLFLVSSIFQISICGLGTAPRPT